VVLRPQIVIGDVRVPAAKTAASTLDDALRLPAGVFNRGLRKARRIESKEGPTLSSRSRRNTLI
jgi:hypothetical protein